jgi:hypothetical protein
MEDSLNIEYYRNKSITVTLAHSSSMDERRRPLTGENLIEDA